MGKWCLHVSLFLGNKDMFKNYKRFDFWHIQTADIGGTKPWKNNCSLIWKLFKFLMTLLAGLFEMRGCWHIGLRWAIVALWAACWKYMLADNVKQFCNICYKVNFHRYSCYIQGPFRSNENTIILAYTILLTSKVTYHLKCQPLDIWTQLLLMIHNSRIHVHTCQCKYRVKTLKTPIFRLQPIPF